MGKGEEEQLSLPSSSTASIPTDSLHHSVHACAKWVRFKCILVLLLTSAVFLSALFWLPPFYGRHEDLDLHDPFRGHDIVARFKVEKPISALKGNISRLRADLFNEIGDVPTTNVVILFLEVSLGSNMTNVVFAVDPEVNHSRISSTAQSLISERFESLVTQESSLRLTESLFGTPFLFEVLKFHGGITITPHQGAFLLQEIQIYFNFTLNSSIYQVQEYFAELTSQLKSGLHLTSYENIYVSLTNTKGSTVAPPTIVNTSVLLAVGITPSKPRLKQLAKTITGSHEKNLGLNNTVFGKVKQVQLSSSFLHGGDNILAPSPAPLPHHHHHHLRHHHHLHHHHHQHHHHRHGVNLGPAPSLNEGSHLPAKGGTPASGEGSPVQSPSPVTSFKARAPSRQIRYPGPVRKSKHQVPAVAPALSPGNSAPSPYRHADPPVSIFHQLPTSSPLPSVAFAHVQPPSRGEHGKGSPNVPLSAPLSTSMSAVHFHPVQWAFPLLLVLALHV